MRPLNGAFQYHKCEIQEYTRTGNSGLELCVYHISVRTLLAQPRIMIDPLEDLPMPHQTILPLQDPMVLVWEIQKLARHSPRLQDVKQHDTLRLRQTVVQSIVHDELRRGPVEDVVYRIPAFVIIAVVPESAVELW
jgi:hypothetical protein